MAKAPAQSRKDRAIDASMRIVVLHGPERFLIEEYSRRFIEQLEAQFGAIEIFHFDSTVEPAVLLDEIRSYGLMQKHKLVILDEADAFLSGKKGAAEDEPDSEEAAKSSRRPLMERYAENPVPDATLLMRSDLWRKGKLDKLIDKVGCIVECGEVNQASAINWCVGRCSRRYETQMDRAAATLLVERLGTHLLRLDTEIMKLAAMAGPGQPITRDLVMKSVGRSSEEKAWEIQSAVLTGDSAIMIHKLWELREISNQDLVPITWAIVDLMRKLHAASQLIMRRTPQEAIPRMLKIWGDPNPILHLAAKHRPERFAQLLQLAIQIDQFSKSGVGDPQRNLEGLLVKIADTLTQRSQAAA